MSYGDPHLLSAGEQSIPLSRINMQRNGLQKYDEKFLQIEIDRCPTLLPIRDFYPNVENLCSLGCEIPVPTGDGAEGYIDNLFLTDDAHLVIVETKLWRNPEATREVIAQILQYSMAVSRLTLDELESRIRRGMPKGERLGSSETIFQYACRQLSERSDDFEDSFDRLRRSGDILLLIVGDGIRASAERLVQWMNKSIGGAPTKLGLVELRVYDYLDIGRIIVPRTLLRIKEASRYVVAINLQGEGKENVSVTVTESTAGSTPRTIASPSNPMTGEQLTEQIRAKNPPEIAELAEIMRTRLLAVGLKSKGYPSCISYGIEVDGDFIPLLSVSPTNIWWALPIRAIRALGDERFLECKRKINEAADFYRPEDIADPTKTSALGPRFRILDGKLDAFVEAVKEIAETVRIAMAEVS